MRIALATALWPLPALGVAVAVALAVGLRHVDLTLLASGREPPDWVFGGDGSAARSILSAIATSLATMVTLLFSLTIVTLQLASTQYSTALRQKLDRVAGVERQLRIADLTVFPPLAPTT